MNKAVRILIIILLIICFLLSIKTSYSEDFYIEINSLEEEIENYDLTGIDKLMIVAHPDDEMLWGGKQLIEDDYLVVCVTCGTVEKREIEFENVMNATNDYYISLNYPDLTNGKVDDWSKDYRNIEKDIYYIINYKNWDMVVTHNPEGEYGHAHHKMTSNITTKYSQVDKLYYFNRYYKKEQLNSNTIVKMDEDILKEKEDILSLYETQKVIIEGHYLNMKNEKLISYYDWFKKN